MSFTNVDVHL